MRINNKYSQYTCVSDEENIFKILERGFIYLVAKYGTRTESLHQCSYPFTSFENSICGCNRQKEMHKQLGKQEEQQQQSLNGHVENQNNLAGGN